MFGTDRPKDSDNEEQLDNKQLNEQYEIITRELIVSIDTPKQLSFMTDINYIKKVEMLGYNVKILSEHIAKAETDKKIIICSDRKLGLEDIGYIRKEDNKSTMYCYDGLFEATSFTSIDFTNVNTSHIRNFSNMFAWCKAKSINFTEFKTDNAVYMDKMFYMCSVEHLNIAQFKTENVLYIDSMFYGCKATSINIENVDITNAIDTKDMFKCYNGWVITNNKSVLNELNKSRGK